MWKVTPSRSLVIRINLVFIACFLIIYATLLLRPSTSVVYHESATAYVPCSLRDCHHKAETGYKMKAVLLEDPIELNRNDQSNKHSGRKMVKRERPSFLNSSGFMGMGMRIGIVNMENEDLSDWNVLGKTIPIKFEKVSNYFEWKDLFPEWIDEEEEMHGTLCPEVPMPDYKKYGYMDMIVVNIPCKFPEEGWARDVFRLQLHLIVANMVVRRGRKSWNRKPKVVVLSKCRPMVEIFRCDDLLVHDGDWWFYEPDMKRLEQKVFLPVGTCHLALPLWDKGIDEVYDVQKIQKPNTRSKSIIKREAYATVLHSTESYVCGAIMLAQSLLKTGTNRDLILLIDTSISIAKRQALAAAGWTIRIIDRIRNPRAENGTYNEFNYSKFRLWQLTDYDKIIFIDSDIIVLRNLDLVFSFPQMSAVGNDNSIFNSGIMVIEPSNCTFMHFMQQTNEIISYNGGDQGFLNEIFVYWHRLPRRVNFLKNFWSNTTVESSMKNQLFGADPPKLYTIHYLGLKPWLCYRDYDCNWDIDDQRVYASDVAHRTWWKLHDTIDDESLKSHCNLSKQRKIELKWDQMQAKKIGFADEHWKINITDPRRRG